MAKTIIIGGFGSGISQAIAEKFGAEGFSVALVARSEDKIVAGAKALEAKGIKVGAFAADLGDPASVKAMVAKVRSALGPITIVQWNAYSGAAGDLLAADAAGIRNVYDVAVTGLVTAVQEALPDLKTEKNAAVLVTNGGLGFNGQQVDAMGVQWNAMGLSIANAAKHKLVGLLSEKLKGDNVYVGEVVVMGAVKGTAFDSGSATLEAKTIAAKFWEVYEGRTEVSTNIS